MGCCRSPRWCSDCVPCTAMAVVNAVATRRAFASRCTPCSATNVLWCASRRLTLQKLHGCCARGVDDTDALACSASYASRTVDPALLRRKTRLSRTSAGLRVVKSAPYAVLTLLWAAPEPPYARVCRNLHFYITEYITFEVPVAKTTVCKRFSVPSQPSYSSNCSEWPILAPTTVQRPPRSP
jgi:hypothetical protein